VAYHLYFVPRGIHLVWFSLGVAALSCPFARRPAAASPPRLLLAVGGHCEAEPGFEEMSQSHVDLDKSIPLRVTILFVHIKVECPIYCKTKIGASLLSLASLGAGCK
jgi:hypothetical protein